MKAQEIRHIARQRGLNPARLDKTSLIRAIQRQEGNFDCFATAWDGQCNQHRCAWRDDCFALARSARPPDPRPDS